MSEEGSVSRQGGNLMSADEWLHRVLYSGQITRVAQHLALVIHALAHQQTKNGVAASLRDLERITGWGRSTLQDHLAELEMCIKVTPGRGRGKSVFELQGIIEDAIGKALASGVIVRQPDAKSVVAGEPDAIVAHRPDTNVVAGQPDATPDATLKNGHATQSPAYKDTGASKESPSEIVIPSQLVSTRAQDGLAGWEDDFVGQMVGDIQRWMGVPEANARQWLGNQVRTYGSQAAGEAYQKLKTDLGTGSIISRPLQAWCAIAGRLKAEITQPAKSSSTGRPTGRPRPSVRGVMGRDAWDDQRAKSTKGEQ